MKHAALLAVIIAVAALLVHNKISSAPWDYDEADYMYAASLGIGTNWHDSGTMPITQFVSAGRRQGADPQQRGALSAMARSADDPVVYRHWHGPLYYFYLTAVSSLNLSEHRTRAFSFVFATLTAIVMYFGSLWILGGATGQIAAVLSSTLFLWSTVTLKTSEIAPHMLFVLIYVSLLLLLTRAATDGGKNHYYAAVCCAGLAFCTMEVAFVEILVTGFFAWRYRSKLGPHLIRNSLGIFLATVLIVWPTSLLKLSFVKAYLVMAYLAVFRKGAWGNVTIRETWAARFQTSPVEWCLLALALVLFFTAGRKWMPASVRTGGGIFLLFGGLMILATIKVFTTAPRYTAPFSAALELFTAWVIASALARFERPLVRYGALAGICGLMIWNAGYQLSDFMTNQDPRLREALQEIRADGLAQKTLVVDRGVIPTVHYYFPRMHVLGYNNADEIPAMRDHADAVLYPGYSLKMTAQQAVP